MADNKEQTNESKESQNCYDLFKKFIENLSVLLQKFSEKEISDLRNQIDTIKEEEPQSEDGSDKENKDKGKKKPWLDQAIEIIKTKNENQKKLFLYALWLWYMPISNILVSTKNEILKKVEKDLSQGLEGDGLLPLSVNGLASYGQGIVYIKGSILFLLDLFEKIDKVHRPEEKIPEENIKNIIKKNCSDKDTSIKNMLLHLCDRDKYEPIANYNHKEQIVRVFSRLTDNDGNSILGEDEIKPNNIDNIIETIKNHLTTNLKITIDDFYQDNIKYLWMNTDVNNQLSDIQLLEYKKAMVLYGPPGTGKTYTAKLLANSLIKRHFITKGSLQNDDEIKKHIAYLQFHINYNYEDFIAGQTIKDNTVRTKKGFIFNVIEEAKQTPDVPYVVILDEMNRTDVSRVFGELFTAIEKRGEDVVLSLPDPINQRKNLTLNLPDNIYFIGTMNEIDFSLERIDFALRRRFIWQECGYSPDNLKDLMGYLLKKEQISVDDTVIETYVIFCTALNKEIAKKIDETYHIGHSFFAEIVNVYKRLVNNGIQDDIWSKAKNILWQISIKPTLDAYCGTMPEEEKKRVMQDFKNAFFEKQEKKAKSKSQEVNTADS